MTAVQRIRVLGTPLGLLIWREHLTLLLLLLRLVLCRSQELSNIDEGSRSVRSRRCFIVEQDSRTRRLRIVDADNQAIESRCRQNQKKNKEKATSTNINVRLRLPSLNYTAQVRHWIS